MHSKLDNFVKILSAHQMSWPTLNNQPTKSTQMSY